MDLRLRFSRSDKTMLDIYSKMDSTSMEDECDILWGQINEDSLSVFGVTREQIEAGTVRLMALNVGDASDSLFITTIPKPISVEDSVAIRVPVDA